jgi:molybdenum cofactor cytidylyltransferase
MAHGFSVRRIFAAYCVSDRVLMPSSHPCTVAGILLAAGKGRRFDPDGVQDKLLQRLPSGDVVIAASANHLYAALTHVVAVIRPDSRALRSLLEKFGCDIVECNVADQGMAASLVHALKHARDADGWLIALADMPFVSSDTIAALAQAICDGADIAVPIHQGRRGNPVAFSRAHLADLLQLQGDQGARRLLKICPVTEVTVDDSGILRDIDTPEDLRAAQNAPDRA